MTRPTPIAIASILAIAILATAFAQPANALPPHARNFSSHPSEFFRNLLAGRVFVHERNGAPAAIHYREGGTFYACWLADDAYFRRSPDEATWQIGTRSRLNNIQHRTYHPRFGERFMRRVMIYTPDTGRFHFEAYYRKPNEWRIDREGWIQEAWPRVLIDNCRDLNLPKDFPVDEAQTAYRFETFKQHANPILNHPGSERRFPGATGIAAAGNGPTLTPEDVEAALRSYEGKIIVSATGKRYAFHSLAQSREVWSLDPQVNVIDVATVRLDIDKGLFITRWQRSRGVGRLAYRYPMFAMSTGQPHPVFAMMEAVVRHRTAVPIPDGDGRKIAHVFHADGGVRTHDATGAWRISAGKVEMTFDHLTHAYPWRVFAGFADWKSD